MSNKLSRRELVCAIGAGMTVSACSVKDGEGDKNGSESRGPLENKSCDNVGANPHEAPPETLNVNPPFFKPNYIAILGVELGPDWSMAVNHANFALQENEKSPDGRKQKALDALDETWLDDTKPRKRFGENKVTKPRKRGNGSLDDHDDFEKFKFNHEIELFIYIYQRTISPTKGIFPEKRLLSFGSFMQKTDGNNIPLPAIPNCSYFNAAPVDLSHHPVLNDHGFLFRVENWSRDENGKPVGSREVLHSMNIHFSVPVKTATGKVIPMPMVFDPDTGNGTGNEP